MNLCSSCGLDFGSVQAFDRHRVGTFEYTFQQGLERNPPVEDGRRCLDPDEIETLRDRRGEFVFEMNSRGAWSLASGLAKGRALGALGSDAPGTKPLYKPPASP